MTILASVNNKTLMPGITPIADVPDRPTIGTATGVGLTASITFTAATTGGTPTTYTATSTPGSLTGTASSSPITVSGLTDETSYTFTVRANNSTGSSANSAASNSITAVSPISGGYDSLATVIVPSGGLSSIVFAGIPTGYKHLQIRGNVKSNRASNINDGIIVQYNADTGSNYTRHRLYGQGGGGTPEVGVNTAQTGNLLYTGSGAEVGTSIFAVFIMDLLDYANTNKNKTMRALDGVDANGSGIIALDSGLWINTSAIQTITFTPQSGTLFVQHSSFTLYGVK